MLDSGDTMTPKQLKGLKELLKDSETCARLSNKEEDFLSSIRDRVLLYDQATLVSEKQWAWLKIIEGKVYA